MKLSATAKHDRIQGILVPSITLIFLAATYIIFVEIGPVLKWSYTCYSLYALLLLGSGMATFYVTTVKKDYQKVKAIVSKTELAEAAVQAKLKTLSRKEKEVLALILENKSNKEICELLFISMSTLKSHINHIYHKVEVTRRQEIIALFG